MVCRFNPVAFSAAEKNGKTSWFVLNLYRKSHLFGGKKVFYFEKNENTLEKTV